MWLGMGEVRVGGGSARGSGGGEGRVARVCRELGGRVKAAVEAGGSPVEDHAQLKYDRLFSDIRAGEMPEAQSNASSTER